MLIIDYPSPYSTIEELRSFLNDMNAINYESDEKKEAINYVQKLIEEKLITSTIVL